MKKFITTKPYEESTHLIHTNPACFLLLDNAYPITISLKPEFQGNNRFLFETKTCEYAIKRKIDFKLYIEHENTNTHYHGYICFPCEKLRKNFQQHVNKFGKFFVSSTSDTIDKMGWVRYCEKIESGVVSLQQFRYNNFFYVPEFPTHPPSGVLHPSEIEAKNYKNIIIIPESME